MGSLQVHQQGIDTNIFLNGRKKYHYFDFLKFHIIVLIIPIVISGIVFFQAILHFIHDISVLYRAWTGNRASMEEVTFWWFIRKIFKYGLISMLVALIIRVFNTGLFFVPYLAKQQTLNIRRVLKLGFSKFFAVFFITIGTGILLSVISSVIAFIPLLNVIAFLVVPYVSALLSILYDYSFSKNEVLKKPLLYSIAMHCRELYVNNKVFLLYGLVLMVSYMFLASVFIKPYIQLKILELLDKEPLNFSKSIQSSAIATTP